jgi:hypothetical protein
MWQTRWHTYGDLPGADQCRRFYGQDHSRGLVAETSYAVASQEDRMINADFERFIAGRVPGGLLLSHSDPGFRKQCLVSPNWSHAIYATGTSELPTSAIRYRKFRLLTKEYGR